MYFYEKLQHSKNLEDFIKYFDENYEKDKTEALKDGPVQLWATLDMIALMMRTHRELYIKKFSKEDYEKLNMKGSGKTPQQLVEADLEAVVAKFKMTTSREKESHVTRYNLFPDHPSEFNLREPREPLGEDLSDLESQSSRNYGSLAGHDSDSDGEADKENWCKRFLRKMC